MPRYACRFLDVFAERPLTGNGLAVVHGADDLADETMHAFARETRLSETAFVQTAAQAGASYRNRIWMPSGEAPFGGHPSLGTAVAVALDRGERELELVQESAAGLHPIHVHGTEARFYASMLVPAATLGDDVEPAALAAALALDPGDFHPELPVQVASSGLPMLIAPLRSPAPLGRIAPRYTALAAVLAPLSVEAVYVVHWSEAASEFATARAFARDVRIGEDPATGAAAAALCTYLHRRAGVRALKVRQGREMGRPSVIDVGAGSDGVRLGGPVVPVLDGTLVL